MFGKFDLLALFLTLNLIDTPERERSKHRDKKPGEKSYFMFHRNTSLFPRPQGRLT